MGNNLIDELNKTLTNTLGYREKIQKLANAISHRTTIDKLKEFAKIADKEAERLIQTISELGGDVESTERQTDQETISWVPPKMPDTSNMQCVVEHLIKMERKKEDDYDAILGHEDINRKTKNVLKKHRKQAESNLIYFQTALQTLEKK